MRIFSILLLALLFVLIISTSSYAFAQSQTLSSNWVGVINKFWSQNQISDQEFVNAYKYLMHNKMMVVYGANYSQDNSFEAQLTQTKQIASYFDTSNSHKLVLVSTKASDLNQFISVKNHFIYVEPLPNWYAHSDDAILSATDYWIKTDNVKFNLVSVPSDSAITVKWIKETNLPASGYTIGNKVIEIGLGDTKCDGVWHPYDQSFISKVLRHELGHALGHKHSTNSSDVMYPIISDKKYILTADASNSLNIC